jgi:hypothetical protein
MSRPALLLLSCLLALPAAETLVPLQQSGPQVDGLNFQWDLNLDGMVRDGSNDCFDGAMGLWVTSSQHGQRNFQHDQRPQVTADGGEWVLANTFGDLGLIRRIRLDPQRGLLRYVDLVENRGGNPIDLVLQINADLGHSVMQAVLDGGRLATSQMALQPEERGLLMTQQGGRPSLVFFLGSGVDGLEREIAANAGQGDIWYRFSFTVPANSSVAVMHVVGQRQPNQLPQPVELDVCADPAFVADLPREVRELIINLPRSAAAFAMLSVDDLGLEAGATDLVAYGEDNRLRGTLGWRRAELEGRFGTLPLDTGTVLALSGPAWSPERDLVFLRDGQVLSGRLQVEEARLHLDAGFTVALDDRPLDRVRFRQDGSEEEGPRPGWFVATRRGDVFRVEPPTGISCDFATPWGRLRLPLDQLSSLAPMVEDPLGASLLTTVSGTRLPVLLAEGGLVLQHERFGALALDALECIGLRGPASFAEAKAAPADLAAVTLGQFALYGQVADEHLELIMADRPLAVPWAQIAALVRREGRLQVECWNGSRMIAPVVAGQLLHLRLGESELALPLATLQEVKMPRPGLNPAQRARILDLVVRLGAESWSEREAASRELRGFGAIALPLLAELREDQRDEEILHRLELLLRADAPQPGAGRPQGPWP